MAVMLVAASCRRFLIPDRLNSSCSIPDKISYVNLPPLYRCGCRRRP
jgi:hypothetical protein